jgi:hypothetical protein
LRHIALKGNWRCGWSICCRRSTNEQVRFRRIMILRG